MSRPRSTPCDGSPKAAPFGAVRSRIQFSRVRRGDDPVNSYSITSWDESVEYHKIRNVTTRKVGAVLQIGIFVSPAGYPAHMSAQQHSCNKKAP